MYKWSNLVRSLAAVVLGASMACPAALAKTLEVKLVDVEFQPARIKLSPGDRIKFTNLDPFEHTVLIVDAANPNVVIVPEHGLAPNATFTTDPIAARGVFTLYCTLHGGMKGEVTTTGSFVVTAEMRAAAAGALPPEVKAGEKLFWGRAQCFRCHSIGTRGDADYGPDLADIGLRAASRARARGLGGAQDYIVESILRPAAYVVPGYANDMPRLYLPPVRLGRKEIVALVAYLESQGGKVDLWQIDVPEAQLAVPPPPRLPVAKRDPQAGEKLFHDMLGCSSCHRVGARGGGMGPELTHIGAYRDEAFFLREILDPGAVVPAGYRPVELVLAGGERVRGVLRKQTPRAYTVKLSDGSERTVPKAEVEKVDLGEGTNMPGYTDITVRQLADLVSYLETLR